MSQFYALTANLANHTPYAFDALRGKVVVVVNVASKCGFTPQYQGFETLYSKYHDQGLEILGFPCNQFGDQEPGTEEQIVQFCSATYNVSFPIMEKVEVNGDAVHPVYQWLKSQKSGLLGMSRIKWNFEKFVVDREGKVVERYASTTTPESIEGVIAGYLKPEKTEL